jgi:hypothetical protein
LSEGESILVEWFPAHRVKVDETIDGLIPGHTLLVKELGVDDFGIRLSYEIRPPLPQFDPREPPLHVWYLFGQDDTGHEYDERGGAFGLSEDGTFTEGVRTLHPKPDPKAVSVTLEFSAPDQIDTPDRVLSIRLPER